MKPADSTSEVASARFVRVSDSMAFKGFISYSHGADGKLALAWSGVASLAASFVAAVIAAYLATQQRNLAIQRLADLCKSLDEAQVLSDSSNHGSVYYFRSEFAEIAEQCKKVNYQTWH